jgi:hypothetical protein
MAVHGKERIKTVNIKHNKMMYRWDCSVMWVETHKIHIPTHDVNNFFFGSQQRPLLELGMAILTIVF